MKKLILVICIILYAISVDAAIVVRDDFTRADTTAISDSTHPWLEYNSYGEAYISGNRLQWDDTSATGQASNAVMWAGDYCNDDCTIQVDVGISTTVVSAPVGIGIKKYTDALTGCSIELRKNPSTGQITFLTRYCTPSYTMTAESSTAMTQNVTEQAYMKIYKNGSDVMADLCWGAVGNPCSGWSKLNFNLTSAGVPSGTTQGYPGIFVTDNTATALHTFYFDNYSLDTSDVSSHKPWLTGLTSTGVTVHVKATSTAKNVEIQYGTNSALTNTTSPNTPLSSNMLITLNAITGLSSGTKYYYRYKIGDTIDSNIYSFTTLPTAGVASNYSFAVVACTDTDYSWTDIITSKNPLFILAIGDFPYLDVNLVGSKLGSLRSHMSKLFDEIEFQNMASRTPIYYMWNDHDSGWDESFGEYGNQLYSTGTIAVTNGSTTVTGTGTTWTNVYMGNGSGSNYNSDILTLRVSGDLQDYRVTSRTATSLTLNVPYHGVTGSGLSYQIFKEMRGIGEAFPIMYDNKTIPSGYDSDAFYYTFQVGRTKFWVMDTQKYASNYANTDDINKTMLGANQKLWIRDTYQVDTSPMKFIITPEPLWTDRDGTNMSWKTSYTHEMNNWWKSLFTGKTMIIAGDSHQLASSIPFNHSNTVEINSSKIGMANTGHTPTWKRNWWVEDWIAERLGFAIVNVTDNGTDINAEVVFYYNSGTVANRVNFFTKSWRAITCSYDATYCPEGRSLVP